VRLYEKRLFNRGLILVYPGYQNEAKLYQYNRLTEEFEKLGVTIDKLKVDDIVINIKAGKPNIKLDEYDFCIQLVKDKYINEILNKNKIKTFNNYLAMDNCDDKMMTYILLTGHNILMPSTILRTTNIGVENIKKEFMSEEFENYVENVYLGHCTSDEVCNEFIKKLNNSSNTIIISSGLTINLDI
jgi:hypothetical protein